MSRMNGSRNGPSASLNGNDADLDDWQNGKTLAEANLYMLDNELACDVKFAVGEGREQVPAHKYVLISRSPILQQAFADHLDKDNVMVNVPDVDVVTFRDVLMYMYSGMIDIRANNVGPVLYAAKRFQIKGLLSKCVEFLESSIAIESASKILEQAHTYNESKLFDKCLKFILVNAADVLRTRAFLELCTDCVKKIVCSDDLKADEELIFESMMDWSTGECRRKGISATDQNHRQVLGNLLYQIRFPTMDVVYFTQRVSFRDILSDDEAVSVYQYFHGEERQLSRKFNKKERNRIKSKRNYLDREANQVNVQPMSTAQFVESRRSHRRSPAVRFVTPEPPKPVPVVLDIPNNLHKSRVSRFISSDGQWKQNGPPDAISFTCSDPIVLYGIEIYGSVRDRESYKVKLYLYDDMKEEVCRNEVVVTTDSFSRTCDVMFSRAVRVPPGRVFTVVVALKGNSCNKGVQGRSLVDCDGVRFEFMNSNRSSNGTDVTVGQIPALIFSRTD